MFWNRYNYRFRGEYGRYAWFTNFKRKNGFDVLWRSGKLFVHHQFFIYGNWVLGFLTLGCPIIAWSVDERPAILLRFPLKLPSFYWRLALFCFLCGVKTIENGASRLRKSLGKRRGVDALMLGDFDVLDPYHEDWTPKQPLALHW